MSVPERFPLTLVKRLDIGSKRLDKDIPRTAIVLKRES